MKIKDWQELTRMTGEEPIVIEKVRLLNSDITIEGQFELPPLARISAEDQIFVMAFVKNDGSIKDMEKAFGVSYPTIKSRLSRIAGQFRMVENLPAESVQRQDVLTALERGEITAVEAIERLAK